MFRRSLLIGLSLLLLGGGLLAFMLFRVNEGDHQEYHHVVAEATSASVLSKLKEPGRQERTLVSKELWILDGTERRLVRLNAKESTLEFLMNDSNASLVEHMQKVTGLIQARLYYLLPDGQEVAACSVKEPLDPWIAMQEVHLIEADAATYDYNQSRFISDAAWLTQFRLEGHELPDRLEGATLLLTGRARSAEIEVKNGELCFIAHHLKATIQGEGRWL